MEGKIGGRITDELKKAENEDDPAETGEKETQDMQASSLAGVSLESATQLLDAVTSDAADFYETGVFDMAFVENIEVYENYVQSDAFTTADDAAAEVIEEKESNTIYVVESGDCILVLAIEHDTKV